MYFDELRKEVMKMAGYFEYSMSNNAVDAYESGEKPLSKWTKKDIFKAIEEDEIELNCSVKKLKKLPLKILKKICLYKSSWHHTSCKYNATDFYSLDIDRIEILKDAEIDGLLAEYKSDKKGETTEEKWECSFLEWSGSRNHPKAKEITEVGIIRGSWFYRKDGSKKKTTAKGFKFLKKIIEA